MVVVGAGVVLAVIRETRFVVGVLAGGEVGLAVVDPEAARD